LITSAFERFEPREELRFARLTFELLRPVPFAPFDLQVRITRAGRRVQELAAELHAGGELVCRAAAVRGAGGADRLPEPATARPAGAGGGADAGPRRGHAGQLRARRLGLAQLRGHRDGDARRRRPAAARPGAGVDAAEAPAARR